MQKTCIMRNSERSKVGVDIATCGVGSSYYFCYYWHTRSRITVLITLPVLYKRRNNVLVWNLFKLPHLCIFASYVYPMLSQAKATMRHLVRLPLDSHPRRE